MNIHDFTGAGSGNSTERYALPACYRVPSMAEWNSRGIRTEARTRGVVEAEGHRHAHRPNASWRRRCPRAGRPCRRRRRRPSTRSPVNRRPDPWSCGCGAGARPRGDPARGPRVRAGRSSARRCRVGPAERARVRTAAGTRRRGRAHADDRLPAAGPSRGSDRPNRPIRTVVGRPTGPSAPCPPPSTELPRRAGPDPVRRRTGRPDPIVRRARSAPERVARKSVRMVEVIPDAARS